MRTKNLLLLSSLTLFLFCFNSSVYEVDKEKVLKNVRQLLSYFHYSPKDINDEFSQEVFDKYVSSLDPFKRNFTQEEYDSLALYRNELDTYYENSDLTFYELSNKMYHRSLEENQEFEKEIFKGDFDFDKEEYMLVDDEKMTYPKSKEEKKDKIRKFLKFLILDKALSLKEDEANAGLSKVEILDKAIEEVEEDREDLYRLANNRKKDELFAYYVNAFAETYDPHTYYFSPKDKEYFDQSIAGSFEGIGATLKDEKGVATITSLIIGGPAWKTKKVLKDDQILEVAQEGEDAVSIIGMNLDDAILLIRGEKGTTVTLTLKHADGSVEKVQIVRDVIEIEDSFVKSAILEGPNGYKHGFISIPSFYINPNDPNGRGVAGDVKKELLKLKEAGVNSIVLDVRNNGGGSLGEVVDIVGFFIKDGPVVQARNNSNKDKVFNDTDPTIFWDGPLAVMTNEYSASASEILAAAIQDYGRGIIIGSEQTFGKGTVQQVWPLERIGKDENLGDIKYTVQKFYRINGGSTQLKGVASDIVIPDRNKYTEVNEKSQPDALAWDEIKAVKYKKWEKKIDIEGLRAKSASRLNNNAFINVIEEEAQWLKNLRNQDKISLQYDAYMTDLESKEKKLDDFKEKRKFESDLKVVGLAQEEELYKTDTIFKAKRDDWFQNIKKDFYIQESVNVMSDYIQN